jgi:hypothetical protein
VDDRDFILEYERRELLVKRALERLSSEEDGVDGPAEVSLAKEKVNQRNHGVAFVVN